MNSLPGPSKRNIFSQTDDVDQHDTYVMLSYLQKIIKDIFSKYSLDETYKRLFFALLLSNHSGISSSSIF